MIRISVFSALLEPRDVADDVVLDRFGRLGLEDDEGIAVSEDQTPDMLRSGVVQRSYRVTSTRVTCVLIV